MNLFRLNTFQRLVSVVLTLAFVPFVPLEAYFSHSAVAPNLLGAAELSLSVGVDASSGDLGPAFPSATAQLGVEHSSTSVPSELLLTGTTAGNGAFCAAIEVTVDTGSITQTASASTFTLGPLPGQNDLAVYDVSFAVQQSTTTLDDFPHGAGCAVSLTTLSSQVDVPAGAGFFDEQTVTWQLTAQQIVLNEVLADPASGEVEFIELFNTGSAPIDVAGWTITEVSGSGNVVSHTVVSNPALSADLIAYDDSGTTVVPAGGHLALKFAGSVQYLNNDGDTITLLDGSGDQLDQYAYATSFTGKSDARIPDGIGDWIDPIPTPGAANRVEEKEGGSIVVTSAPSEVSVDTDQSNPSAERFDDEKTAEELPAEPATSPKDEIDADPIVVEKHGFKTADDRSAESQEGESMTEEESLKEAANEGSDTQTEAEAEVPAEDGRTGGEGSGESTPEVPVEAEEAESEFTPDTTAEEEGKTEAAEPDPTETAEPVSDESKSEPTVTGVAHSPEDEELEESEGENPDSSATEEESTEESVEVLMTREEESPVAEESEVVDDTV